MRRQGSQTQSLFSRCLELGGTLEAAQRFGGTSCSSFPKTMETKLCRFDFTGHLIAGCTLMRGDWRNWQLSFKPKGSCIDSETGVLNQCSLFHAQVYQGLKGAVHAGGTGELSPGARGGLLLPHLVGGVQLLLGEGLAGGADRLCYLLDLPFTFSPPHIPSVFTPGFNSFLPTND